MAIQVGRITEEIGQEMAEKRDLKTNQFQDKTLASAVIGVPRVAVVEMDGGRFLAQEVAVLVLGRMRHPGRKTRSPA